MAKKKVVLIIGLSDTKCKATLVDKKGKIVGEGQQSTSIVTHENGWQDGDALATIYAVRASIQHAVLSSGIKSEWIAGIGIVNDSDQCLIWDKKTGQPLGPMILSDCSRVSQQAKVYRQTEAGKSVIKTTRKKVGLGCMSLKIKWILDQNEEIKKGVERNKVVVGTLESWVVYHLTGKTTCITDISNASKTHFLNPHTGKWDPYLCEEFGLKVKSMPKIASKANMFGATNGFVPLLDGIPIAAVISKKSAQIKGVQGNALGTVSIEIKAGLQGVIYTGKQVDQGDEDWDVVTLAEPDGGMSYGVKTAAIEDSGMSQWLTELVGDSTNDKKEGSYQFDTKGVHIIPKQSNNRLGNENKGPVYTMVGLHRNVTRDTIQAAAEASLIHQFKQQLIGCDHHNMRIKELKILGSDCGPECLQYIADIIQLPVISYQHPYPEVVAAAVAVNKEIKVFSERLFLVETCNKVKKTYIPVMDPLSSYSCHEGWEAEYKIVNRKKV